MKRTVMLICLSWLFLSLNAQQPIASLPLGVTVQKTTFLLFPFPIIHVDRGTQDILIQQVSSAKNVLLIKAGVPDFNPTNLTVMTEDAAVYAFNVRYDSLPVNTVFRYPVVSSNPSYNSVGKQLNVQDLDHYARMIAGMRKSIGGLSDEKWDMKLSVKGIFIKGEVMFFQMQLTNESNIDFTPEYIRFYIKDQKKGKRTANQEVELKPLFTSGEMDHIPGNESRSVVFAFEKFTIPDAKYLITEIMEKNGGRNLALKITNKKLIRAQTLPDKSE